LENTEPEEVSQLLPKYLSTQQLYLQMYLNAYLCGHGFIV